jgi:hypothetical protein
MKIIKNEKLIKRNSKIGQWTSMGALGVLAVGMYISFTNPELFVWAMGALLLGFVLTQIGMYFGNRWGRSPRPDEKLDAGLKGLTKNFSLYHWKSPVSHLLVGPSGIWILLPYHQRGQVTFRKNRWRMSGGGFLQGYMRIFGQEGIGRPDLEADSEIRSLTNALSMDFEDQIPEIKAILVFTADDVQIDAEDAPIPVLPLKKLKDFMRQRAKEKTISDQDLEKVKELLPQE